MKRVIKSALLVCAALLLALAGCIAFSQISYSRARPPKSVTDVSSCLAWLKEPDSAYRIKVDGLVFYQITGPYLGDLPSGRSACTFDAQGKFIGWTPDEGDIHVPEQVFQTNRETEKISLDELKQIFKL